MELQSNLLTNKLPLAQTKQEREEEDHQRVYQQSRDIVSRLPIIDGCWLLDLRFHDGWFGQTEAMVNAMAVQKLFHARPTDIIMATFPKSGTTWLKALLFSTVSRNSDPASARSLNTLSPHECVPFLENQLYVNNRVPDLDSHFRNSPARLLATHIPFRLLPDSVAESGCRIVYLCRNPKDTFLSLWHFVTKLRQGLGLEALTLEVAFDHFCEGRSHCGPFWNHMLGYWNASLGEGEVTDKCVPKKVSSCVEWEAEVKERIPTPQVLFMKYEELMEDPVREVKRLARFVGYPFSRKEEEDGVVKGIVESCGFEKLSNLEVNKVGKTKFLSDFANSNFFRQGVVGDWKKHLTPDMALRLDGITKSKLEGSGLSF